MIYIYKQYKSFLLYKTKTAKIQQVSEVWVQSPLQHIELHRTAKQPVSP